MADLILDGTSIISKTGSNNPAITSGLDFPAGHIIQTMTDTFASSGVVVATTTPNDIYGENLEVTITPTSTSNKLLLNCFIPDVYGNAIAGRALNAGFRYDATFSGNGTQLGDREFIADHQGYNHEAGAWLSNLSYFTVAIAPVDTAIKIRPWLGTVSGDCNTFGNAPSYGVGCLVVQEIQV